MTEAAKPIGYASLSGLKELAEGYPMTIHLIQGAKYVAPIYSADLGTFWSTGIAQRKWAELVAEGATQTGISFTKGTSKGHIDAWGRVTWEHEDVPLQDPCPGCRPGVVCRTPDCGRLKNRA